jgi:hypothetical protein
MFRFLGIGAQKAGTTWLYRMLARHPGIGFPAGKELHFWNRLHDRTTVAAYLRRFADAELAEGEITPAYALLDPHVIREIHGVAPGLRLIYVLRNPAERAWSSALMALRRAEMEAHEASDRWFIDHFRSAGSRGRGDYLGTIRNWRAVFGDDALLLLRFEDIAETPATLLNRCFAHLVVTEVPAAELEAWGLQERVFAGAPQPLRESLRPVLRALYAPQVTDLADYLGWDLDTWLA